MDDRATMLVGKLNALDTSVDVASFLEMRGIKGYRLDEESCPISTWLSDQLECLVTTEDNIRVWNEGGYYGEECTVFETSDAVKDFIDQFDRGLFPQVDADYDEDADFEDEDDYGVITIIFEAEGS